VTCATSISSGWRRRIRKCGSAKVSRRSATALAQTFRGIRRGATGYFGLPRRVPAPFRQRS
jgi:hypothetical protein